jgi:hypothetical protein
MSREEVIAKHFDRGIDGLIFCSFRYYIGRMTISTSSFAEQLAKVYPDLEKNIQDLIKRELEEEFQRDDKARERNSEYLPLGGDCDRAAWQLVRNNWSNI